LSRPPGDWGAFIQVHNLRGAIQPSPDERPVIDIAKE